jgi:hypothetical protein
LLREQHGWLAVLADLSRVHGVHWSFLWIDYAILWIDYAMPDSHGDDVAAIMNESSRMFAS